MFVTDCLVEHTVSFEPLPFDPLNDTALPDNIKTVLFPGIGQFSYALIEPKAPNLVWQIEDSNLSAKRLYLDIYAPWLNGQSIDDEPWYHALVRRSPFLVQLAPDHELVRNLLTYDPDNPDSIFTFWQHHAAMFFVSPMEFHNFFNHCQKFALVENYKKQHLLFNYFRPGYPELLSSRQCTSPG